MITESNEITQMGFLDKAIDMMKKEAPDAKIAPADIMDLGNGLRDIGRYSEAIMAYYILPQKYPADPLAVKALFFAAGVFLVNLNDKDKARQVMLTIKSNYPGNHYEKKIDELLERTEKS